MSTYAQSQPQFQHQGFHQGPSGQQGNAPEVPPGWTARWDDRYHQWFFVNVQTGVSQWEPPMPSHSPSPHHDNQSSSYETAVPGQKYYTEDEALASRLQAEEYAHRDNAPAMPPRPHYSQPTAPPSNQHLQPPMQGAHGGLSPGYSQPYQSHSPSHSNVSLAGSASPGHSRPSSRPSSAHSYQNYGMAGSSSSHSGGGTTSQLASAGKKLLGSSGKKKEKKHGSSASSVFKSMGKALGESLSGDGGGGDGGGGGGDGGGGGAC